MEVNAQIIKEYRTSRAYTQQHLADACDISLRTIQRVERYGVASSETLMSLSAVFEIDAKVLLTIVEDDKNKASTNKEKINIGTVIIAILFGSLLGSTLTYIFLR